MKIKRTKGEIVFDAAIYFFVGMISLACLYPMLYVLFASLSEPTRIYVSSRADCFGRWVSLSRAMRRSSAVRTSGPDTLIHCSM